MFLFGRHTGASRYPAAGIDREIWIPAFAGMTFYPPSLLLTEAKLKKITHGGICEHH
jgi:hypothetical protein